MTQPTLGLCLIVKNEEKNLPRLLDSVAGVFDQVCITDTGSSDRTREIILRYKAKLSDFKWIDDFSAARNFSFSQCKCDFVMWLDADDILLPGERIKLLALKKDLSADVYYMWYDYFQDDEGRSAALLRRERIIRRGVAQWHGEIHEGICIHANMSMVNADITITHKRDAHAVISDQGRNIRLLEKAVQKRPDDQRMRYYYAKELGGETRNDEAIQQFLIYFKKPDFIENQINARHFMSVLLFSAQRYDEAIQCCLEGIKLDPRFAEFYCVIGMIYHDQQSWNNAIHWLKQAADMPIPDTPATVQPEYYKLIPYDRISMCYAAIGMAKEAYEANEKALALKPNEPRYRHNQGIFRAAMVKQPVAQPKPVSTWQVPTWNQPTTPIPNAVGEPKILPIPNAVGEPKIIPLGASQRQLVVMTSAMGGNIEVCDFLRPIIQKLGMKFVTMSEWPQHDVAWKLDTWLQELVKSDIVVCAQRRGDIQPAKSNNRVTQAMSLGLPVIASPLNAYKEAIVHGETGFICDSPDEWEAALVKLQDAGLRERIGKAAKASAAENYSIDVIGGRWKQMLDGLCRESCNGPRVDIIIPTWNNLHYLKECIKAIRANTDYPCNIIVVNSGTDGTAEWIGRENPDIICHNHPTRLHFAAANNIGLQIAKEKFVCFLNDDTIVAKHWLTALMHEAMKPGIGGVNPWSNCDLNWLHTEIKIVDGISLYPGMVYDNVAAIIPKLYDLTHEKVVTQREWLAMFCTVVPREALDKLGPNPFDENFKSGCEDKDIFLRLAKFGYRFLTTFDAVCFHFGGQTRKNAEKFSKETHQREDHENNMYLMQKHSGVQVPPSSLPPESTLPLDSAGGATRFEEAPLQEMLTADEIREALRRRAANAKRVEGVSDEKVRASLAHAETLRDGHKRVTIYTGQAWERWSPKSVDDGGIGGSETCTIYTAKEFQKRGYEVVVYGDCADREGDYDGVKYLHHDKFDPTVYSDIFISSRRVDVFQLPINARKKVCIAHDIWYSDNANADMHTEKVDKYLVLSEWHKGFLLGHHRSIPEGKVYVTRDAIDHSRFSAPLPRIRGRMVYSSSPDRGLDVLLDCLPRIRQRVPEASVSAFYGFDNWEKAVKLRGNRSEIDWMNRIKEQLKQPGVQYFGRVGQDRLAKEILQAELWAYPTSFTETFCMTAAENMAAGVPVVCTDLAALHTTVGDAGILLQGDPRSEAYQHNFVDACCTVLTDRTLWENLSARSRAKATEYRWDTLIDDWIRVLA